MGDTLRAESISRAVCKSDEGIASERAASPSANSVRMIATRRLMSRYFPTTTTTTKKAETPGPSMAARGSIASTHSPVSKMKTVIIPGPT